LVALCATQQIAHAETVSITGNIQGETCVACTLFPSSRNRGLQTRRVG
jgi:hypothetical protein